MRQNQIFSVYDPLRDFKQNVSEYNNYSFYEHDNGINKNLNIGCGFYNNTLVEEKIITDGIINIVGKNYNKPFIIYNNALLSLDNGLSVLINITNANYFINVINYGNLRQYDIHLVEDNLPLLQTIVENISRNNLLRDSVNVASIEHPGIVTIERFNERKLEVETTACVSEKANVLIKK